MKKIIFNLSIVMFLALQSCSTSSNDDIPTQNQPATQPTITGWWYRGVNVPVYKAYYFGADGVYKQDQSNFGAGMGIGTWSWETTTKIKMIPTSGIAGGIVHLEITKLTNDSLVGAAAGGTLRLSRTNHN